MEDAALITRMKKLIFILAALILFSNISWAGTVVLVPNAAGDVTQCSQFPASGSNWDKVTSNDGDTTYVMNDTVVGSRYDLYNLGDTTAKGIINSVTVSVVCRGTSAATNKKTYVYTKLKTGGVEYNGTESVAVPTIYTTYSTVYNTNPGGGNWTWSQVNSLQAGVNIRVENTANEGRSTYVYVTVNYSCPFDGLLLGGD